MGSGNEAICGVSGCATAYAGTCTLRDVYVVAVRVVVASSV